MHLRSESIPVWLQESSLLALCAIVLAVLLLAPWRSVVASPQRVHLIAGGAISCGLLWLLDIQLTDDITLHLLGVTALTLAVGGHFAILAGIAATLFFYLTKGLPFLGFGVSALSSVAVPVGVSLALLKALQRPRFRNPFFFILGAGFAGGCLVTLIGAVTLVALTQVLGVSLGLDDIDVLLPMLALVMFSEGFVDGMCVAALAIFYPGWVKTFDERFYLEGN